MVLTLYYFLMNIINSGIKRWDNGGFTAEELRGSRPFPGRDGVSERSVSLRLWETIWSVSRQA